MRAAREGGDALMPRRCAQDRRGDAVTLASDPYSSSCPPGVPPQPPTRQARARVSPLVPQATAPGACHCSRRAPGQVVEQLSAAG